MRDADSASTFKSLLKTHLFGRSYVVWPRGVKVNGKALEQKSKSVVLPLNKAVNPMFLGRH